MKTVGGFGATGYDGAELCRLLLGHPAVRMEKISSVSHQGKSFCEIYPNFQGILEQTLASDEEVLNSCEIVFASLPHGLSEKYARYCVDHQKVLIDLGADFRLENPQDYEDWYHLRYQDPSLHPLSAYALPELFRENIKGKSILGNPGCYPTSVALGLAPVLQEGWIDPQDIVCDCKSGVTGAGRGLTQNTHYPDCNEAFAPYKIAQHRHTPEIEQTLSHLCGSQARVTFVPHLLPVNRGILSTLYTRLTQAVTADALDALYRRFYAQEPFVRVQPQGSVANVKNVRCSNYCDISLHLDERCGRLVVVSCIDNMVKGAAGQAIQNMNILLGLEETTGLLLVPSAF